MSSLLNLHRLDDRALQIPVCLPETQFSLPVAQEVSLEVFDVLGRKTVTLFKKHWLRAGAHAVTWDAADQATGMYFYRIRTEDFIRTRKMVLIK